VSRGVIPVTGREMRAAGLRRPDVLLVSGDAFVDHPSFGTAIIARVLEAAGYSVCVLAQPNPEDPSSFLEMGVPRLFVGVTPGNMDSMVNHYTSMNRLRSDDAYSPGGEPGARPDRAETKYVNVLQRVMKGVPVILGGLGPSTRRVSHYDFWTDSVRKSILLDTKASLLVYGMAENTVLEVAHRLDSGRSLHGVRGTCWFGSKVDPMPGDVELPSHEEAASSPRAFMLMTRLIEENQNPWNAGRLIQKADTRTLVVEPPAFPLTTGEMDRVYALPFTGRPHPSYTSEIPAFSMIRNSVTAVRGCPGGCTFCALGVHQGRFITSRSRESVLGEVERLATLDPGGVIVSDIGGPTANVYGLSCTNDRAMKACRRPSCLYPEICRWFGTDHSPFIALLKDAAAVPGVDRVMVSSGIRHDLALRDPRFIEALVRNHVPGHLKIAPEHTEDPVLRLMRKPSLQTWLDFCTEFERVSRKAGRRQYILPYIIAAFPGCTMNHMKSCRERLQAMGALPRQVQVFLPTPMTVAAAVYHTGLDFETGEPVVVRKRPSEKAAQKNAVLGVSEGEAGQPSPRERRRRPEARGAGGSGAQAGSRMSGTGPRRRKG